MVPNLVANLLALVGARGPKLAAKLRRLVGTSQGGGERVAGERKEKSKTKSKACKLQIAYGCFFSSSGGGGVIAAAVGKTKSPLDECSIANC